ncbi:hypothetical protein NOVOSPHI9U_440013 [Novosphingobium sp. 9U]|nr:hypothetical protein NOVOSPHI9U_440013 [Novosphingobium sp. 9U]
MIVSLRAIAVKLIVLAKAPAC